jgi:hypothetical protein
MTVIVWDGATLATDVAATDGAAQWETDKAWQLDDVIMSGAGPLQTILQMRQWYVEGALHNKFPDAQLGPYACHFVVVNKHGLQRWEQGPIPIEHGRTPCAFGEGRDFAYGALAMGATAEQAVEAANKHSVHCGLGVKLYTLGDNYVREESTYTI